MTKYLSKEDFIINEMRKVKEFKNRDHVGIKTTKKW